MARTNSRKHNGGCRQVEICPSLSSPRYSFADPAYETTVHHCASFAVLLLDLRHITACSLDFPLSEEIFFQKPLDIKKGYLYFAVRAV